MLLLSKRNFAFPQGLASVAWGLATLNHKAPSLFDAIAGVDPARIGYVSQALSNTAWAFATMNHEAPLLFDAIARAAPVRINKLLLFDLF
jgi:hypothetical protein